MFDILDYIRSKLGIGLDTENRKRRATEEVDTSTINSSKVRRICISPMSGSHDDEWYSPSSFTSLRRRSGIGNLSTNKLRKFSSPSKENITVNIDDDDDDDILEITRPKLQFSKQCTSTPNYLTQNGDEDVTILKYTQSSEQRKLNARKHGFDYIKPISHLSSNGVKEFKPPRDYFSPILRSTREIKSRIGINKKQPHSMALEQSIRLDEKNQYKQLLAQIAPSSSFNPFSKYVGASKLFGFESRGKKIVDLAVAKSKPSTFIDLTSEANGTDKSQLRLTTKEKIKKILDQYDNETVVIKDSDSDVEVLPVPPSPKPDIKVERVNSLKKVVDTSEKTYPDWLKNTIQKHRDNTTRHEQQLLEEIAQRQKLAKITAEVQTQRLEEQMVECLKIRDAVLPITVASQSVFPELSDDDEARIKDALQNRRNPNEVLSQKFNLNITRRDMATLSGLNWLNDEVINFYMNMIIERGKDSKWPKAYAFNTFFYPKLLKDGPGSLRRWTRRIDLFSYDIIAVPIHLGVHWCMSIIDLRSKIIQYYDSMGNPNRQCLEALFRYLQAEHLDKKQLAMDTVDWELENVSDIPQQMNGSDCGMFACTFAEFITRDAEVTFSQEHMPYLRRKMALEILEGELLIK